MERSDRPIERSPDGFSSLPYTVQVALVAAVYFGAAKVGLSLAFTAEQVSVVWPPTGIALAVVILYGSSHLPAIALGAFLANVTTNVPVLVALGVSGGNTLEALAGAWMLQRLTGFEASLSRVRDVFSLIVFGVVLSTTIGATVGVSSLCFGGLQPWADYNSLWMLWWRGDLMGALIVAPLLLTWSSRSLVPWDRRELADLGVLLLSLFVVGLLLFHPEWTVARIFPSSVLVFPVIMVAALRLGPAGASLATFAFCALAVVHTVYDVGPPNGGEFEQRLLSLQAFLGTAAICGLLLAAAKSERLALASAFRESEERMRYTLEAAHVGTWEWDMYSGAFLWSENMAAIHRLPPGSFGGGFGDYLHNVHPEDRDRVRRAIAGAVKDGAGYHEEYRLLRPDGGVDWLESKGRVFYRPDGGPERMVGVCIDTTRRKNLELRLKDLTDDLERKVEERTAVAERRAAQLQTLASQLTQVETRERRRLSQLLHDGIQQLLVGAKFTVGLMRNQADNRELILQSTEKLDEILQECIHSSRSLSQELTPPGLHDRDMGVALRWLAHEMNDRHGLRVDLDVEGGAQVFSEDSRSFLYQCVREILFNVVKHAEVDRARVRVAHEGGGVRIEVSDSGRGCDVAKLESSESSGLGILTIRERIDQMGGRLEIESAPGKGSRFILVAPGDEKAFNAAPNPPTPRDGLQHPPGIFEVPEDDVTRVLLVDDHRLMREGLTLLLDEEPDIVIVGEASDGMEAIDLARKRRPDVIVMDVSMPGMDGIETTRGIHAEFPAVSIVGLSMHEDGETARRMREAGATVFLHKDRASDSLTEAIRSCRRT